MTDPYRGRNCQRLYGRQIRPPVVGFSNCCAGKLQAMVSGLPVFGVSTPSMPSKFR
jgi:hypothetical protein